MAQQQLQLSEEQRELLMEIGHFHLMLESHQTATRFCRQQLKALRSRLEEVEARASPR